MTYTVKIRGARGLILADFECPEHGRFEAMTERDADEAPCPCPVHLVWLESAPFAPSGCWIEASEGQTPGRVVACGIPSHWVPSPVLGKVKAVSVERGKSDERPPWALNTEALADGMPMKEWKALQDKKDRDWRRKKNREALK